MREEDLLANIANKLMQVISLKIKTEKIDLDIMIDTTLMLWKKCKEVFQKFQTGAQDNYRWVTKLENLGKVIKKVKK
jgi:predicted metal-dependent HD superfamily phosphohydrolase